MAKNNHADKPWYDAAEKWAMAHNLDTTEDAFHAKNFRKAWNDYLEYVDTGKLPKGARKRDIEIILGRKFSKSISQIRTATEFSLSL